MILCALKRIIIVGAAALACLQRATCELTKDDAKEIKKYWTNRASYFGKETNIRSEFFTNFRALNFHALALISDKRLEKSTEIETRMSAIMEEFEHFEKESSKVIEATNSILALYGCIDSLNSSDANKGQTKEEFEAGVKENESKLKKLITPVLDISTSLTRKINKYDSYMVEVIEEHNGIKKEIIELHNLALFKLAKSNKILAADIIYTLSEINPSDLCDEGAKEKMVESLCERILSGVISKSSIQLFVEFIEKDVVDNHMNLLLSGARHFYLLFGPYVPINANKPSLIDDGTLNMYLNLLEENIDEEELEEYMDITPKQVVKLVVIEYVMSRYLMDCKSNTLFRNLGKIVESMFGPIEYSTHFQEDFRIEKEKQDRILKSLSYIWSNQKNNDIYNQARELCSEIGIGHYSFKEIHSSFVSAKWMYEGAIAPLANTDDQHSDNLGVLLDISYIHPLWYICKRCEHVSSLGSISSNNSHLFSQIEKDRVILRPHAIKASDSKLAQAKRMKGCIRAFFSNDIEIVNREKDGDRYSEIVNDFCSYLSSSYVLSPNINKKKEPIEPESAEN
ncbi:hypothetical protein NEMIN01_2405 [Nematocida minor]|uniref:uncharacterized protein n=1 Tax=Nematocida minor TaxID=1912983 RepID=UPI00221FAB56|nr:uncharacterized protein NEMIN01_2405 [Nematocida minor]KAI5193197.1 hypothetical protein NEMIN01_2405 [Nematocida minor]